MVWQWCRFGAAAVCLAVGIGFMLLAVFGVNRFTKALNRMHAAAMGDTLGILFVFLGLIVIRGLSFDSLKLFLVILFFWMASPVSGHMISRLEAMTDEGLGELLIIRKGKAENGAAKDPDGKPADGRDGKTADSLNGKSAEGPDGKPEDGRDRKRKQKRKEGK